MRNKSFKMSIMGDYSMILSAKNFCDLCLSTKNLDINDISKIKETEYYANSLLQTYKKIMFKLGLIDISLAILDKQMLNNYILNKQLSSLSKLEIKDKLNEIEVNLTQIAKNLKLKIKKMELNNFELNYLNIDKLSKSLNYD